VQVELTDYRRDAAWIPTRLDELRDRWGGRVLVDGASRGLLPDAVELTGAEQAQAHNLFSDAIVAGAVRHSGESALNTSVRAARWRPTTDSRVLDRKSSADISPLVAVALAYWGVISQQRPTPQIHEWPPDEEIAEWENLPL
jgi:hypothetical protein